MGAISSCAGCKAVSQGPEGESSLVPLHLTIKPDARMAAAVAAAAPGQATSLSIGVLPSAAPTALVLSLGDARLPVQV